MFLIYVNSSLDSFEVLKMKTIAQAYGWDKRNKETGSLRLLKLKQNLILFLPFAKIIPMIIPTVAP